MARNQEVQRLDYVNAWYREGRGLHPRVPECPLRVRLDQIASHKGEQVGIMWGDLFGKQHQDPLRAPHIQIGSSEARGRAHVHVVIIGFGAFDVARKRIYDYDGEESATVKEVSNISPYLIEGKDEAIMSRTSPLSADAPKLSFGNMPNDGGFLLLDDEEKRALLAAEPGAAGFIRLFLGPDEFIYGTPRWCLWLEGVAPAALRACPAVLERIEGVRTHRSNSTRDTTNKLAATPALFGEIRQPTSWYLAIPKTSSEKRKYIPMAYLDANVVASTDLFTCPGADLYHFGILNSIMHMSWVRVVCGRLKSDYRYSSRLVYNNFPWPTDVSQRNKAGIEKGAQAILNARAQHPTATLADLYDQRTMPASLVRAHASVDRIVDRCYRPDPFLSERARVEFLFAMYERLTAPIIAAGQVRRPRRPTT
jgi:hypothetical protein